METDMEGLIKETNIEANAQELAKEEEEENGKECEEKLEASDVQTTYQLMQLLTN